MTEIDTILADLLSGRPELVVAKGDPEQLHQDGIIRTIRHRGGTGEAHLVIGGLEFLMWRGTPQLAKLVSERLNAAMASMGQRAA